MVVLLLLAILVVLILGFWGEAGLTFLIILGFGALAIAALVIFLISIGISGISLVLLWNNYVVPFWNTHVVPLWNSNKEIIEPPLVTIVIITVWIFMAMKLLEALREKVSEFSLSNDTAFEKTMFFLVGVPSLLIFSTLILVGFLAPIIFVVQEMQKWWLVILAK